MTARLKEYARGLNDALSGRTFDARLTNFAAYVIGYNNGLDIIERSK